jgi:hypothetical protein
MTALTTHPYTPKQEEKRISEGEKQQTAICVGRKTIKKDR